MALREIEWARGDVTVRIDPERRSLVPLYHQASVERVRGGAQYTQSLAFDGNLLWAIGANTAWKIDPNSASVVGSISGPVYIGAAFDGAAVWSATWAGVLSRIDIATSTITAQVSVGPNPIHAAFDGSSVWVTNWTGASVTRVNSRTATATATIPVPPYPHDVAFDGYNIWVASWSGGAVTRIDPATNVVTASIPLTLAQALAFDGTYLWATDGFGSVAKIDVDTAAIVAQIPAPKRSSPAGTSLAFDGSHLWVADPAPNTVRRIDVARAAVVGTVGVPRPWGLAFDGTHVWVACWADPGVARIAAFGWSP